MVVGLNDQAIQTRHRGMESNTYVQLSLNLTSSICELSRSDDGTVSILVYRKAIHTSQYLAFEAQHICTRWQ